MPSVVDGKLASRKRKRGDVASGPKDSNSRFTKAKRQTDAEILRLEAQILESRKHYNNIASLITILREKRSRHGDLSTAAVSLCRIFARLMATGSMVKSKGAPDNEVVIVEWLKNRYQEFVDLLLDILQTGNPTHQMTVLVLLMRLVKDEASLKEDDQGYAFPHGLFRKMVRTLLHAEDGNHVREEFMRKYVEEYDDVRYHTFTAIADASSNTEDGERSGTSAANVFSMLSCLQRIPQSQADLQSFYVGKPKHKKHPVRCLGPHKSRAQDAWLALLKLKLSDDQRKALLGIVSHRVAPWFANVELLMDFLTDSYNVGGSMSLLALSGLFYLIQEKNLDYPLFYQKLYSLLDGHVLHSRHRSRFFRLLETFLASSHLPAALVASFIKRLSRLALHAPPAAIVVVIPWVYNQLKRHPACTFTIHREVDKETLLRLGREGMDDPFDNEEADPMETEALQSSLWEIHMLQSHYHPNVATIANIISEQFTKHAYNLEDFLDHSYGTMVSTELSKELKKAPVVEYMVPKKVFTRADDDISEQQNLIPRLWDFS